MQSRATDLQRKSSDLKEIREKSKNFIQKISHKSFYNFMLERQMAPFMESKLANVICGFRDRHSTQHALLRVIEKIRIHLNHLGVCGMVLMDLSKAYVYPMTCF